MSKERLTVQKGGMLRYRYRAGNDMEFDFHTLAEVGEPYQPWFRNKIENLGWVVEYGTYLDEAPWVADFKIGVKP